MFYPQFLLLALPVLAQQEPAPAPPAPEPAYNATNINFGVGATLPGNVAWKPLTPKERKGLFVNDTFLNPRTIGANTLWAAFDLSKGEPREWRQGVLGYGMRLGSRQLRSTVGNFIHHGAAAGLGYDVRYIGSRSQNPWARLGNAVLLRFATKNREGKWRFDIAGVGATYSQEILATYWIPGQTVTGYALRSANQQMVTGIITNVVREFLPDIKRVFRRKKTTAQPTLLPSDPPPSPRPGGL